MDASFANIKFSNIWDVIWVALIFAVAQVIVIVVKRVIEHKFSHEPTREDRIANDIFDKVKGRFNGVIEEGSIRSRIAEFNLIRELLKKPFAEIRKEILQPKSNDKE